MSIAKENYFDNASTTRLDPRVLAEMLPYFSDLYGNAHTQHTLGLEAHRAVEEARARIANLIDAEDTSQITFTSGATESNATIFNHFRGRKTVIGPFEHSSIRCYADAEHISEAKYKGPEVFLDPQSAEFVSVMTVCNETGWRINQRQIELAAEVSHSDITQHLGKLPLKMNQLTYASASAHKIYGPKGVGFLYSQSPASLGTVT